MKCRVQVCVLVAVVTKAFVDADENGHHREFGSYHVQQNRSFLSNRRIHSAKVTVDLTPQKGMSESVTIQKKIYLGELE